MRSGIKTIERSSGMKFKAGEKVRNKISGTRGVVVDTLCHPEYVNVRTKTTRTRVVCWARANCINLTAKTKRAAKKKKGR